MALGDHGSLTLCGEDPIHHRLLTDHLTGEYRVQTSGRGRTVDEWEDRPEQPDNHWLDCLVGSAVAASMLGVSLLGEKPNGMQRRTIKMSDIQRAKNRMNGPFS